MEQQLKQKDTHIQFKDEIIRELRQQRRFLRVRHLKHSNCFIIVKFMLTPCLWHNYDLLIPILLSIDLSSKWHGIKCWKCVLFGILFQCPHRLEKTKLDSIDKVVDLIRTVRDISPESSKYCDCYNEFYQEKENQTDDELFQSYELGHDHARKIEAQQTEIELLNTELSKKVRSNQITNVLNILDNWLLTIDCQFKPIIKVKFSIRFIASWMFKLFIVRCVDLNYLFFISIANQLWQHVEIVCIVATAIGVNKFNKQQQWITGINSKE